VSATNPPHKSAHLSIDQRPQHQVIVVAHQLVTKKLDLMQLQSFEQNLLKRNKVSFLLENVSSQVTAI